MMDGWSNSQTSIVYEAIIANPGLTHQVVRQVVRDYHNAPFEVRVIIEAFVIQENLGEPCGLLGKLFTASLDLINWRELVSRIKQEEVM